MTTFESDNLFFSLSDERVSANGDWLEAIDDPAEITSDDEAQEPKTKDRIATSESSAQADDLVDRYFGEIRQHDLLSITAERALWNRIERHKARMRRALCLSPLALPTLTRLWNQIKHGEISLQEVIIPNTEDDAAGASLFEHLSDTVAQLHNLTLELSRDRTQGETAIVPAARSWRRRDRARLGRQWVTAWEALSLHPVVYDTLRLDLERESIAQPDNHRLSTAQRVWSAAKRQLDDATAQMLRANLRLVVHVAMRFRDSGVPLLDLIQEGNIGLMRAIDKFDPQRGVKFVTYAHWWVRQAIGRTVINQGRTVRLPSHVVERHNKVRAATDQLWRLSGHAPTAQEIGDALSWTRQEVEQLQLATQGMVTLEQRLPGGDRTVADLLEDPAAQAPNTVAEEDQLKHCLAACFESLEPREAMILRCRFGFETGQPQTLREVGEVLGLSRERVRQIEKASLKRLRESSLMTQLEDFVGG